MITNAEYDLLKSRYDEFGNIRIVCITCRKEADISCAINNHELKEMERPVFVDVMLKNIMKRS
jgi:hypothetical protein